MTMQRARLKPAGARRRSPLRVGMVVYSDYHVDSRVQRQARALAERGDEVDVVSLSPNGEIPVGKGVIRLVQVRVGKARGGAAAYLGGYASFLARAAWTLTALDRRRRFHVVETHNMPDAVSFCALVPRLRGAKVVLNFHDTFPELFATKFGRDMGHPAVRAAVVQERLSAALADAHITVTTAAQARLQQRGIGRNTMEVVMNTPDERTFGPPRPPIAAPGNGRVRAIYHGGLDERFGPELLIRAVGQLGGDGPELSLRICGTGNRHAELAELAAQVAPGRVDVAPAPLPLDRIPGELERANLGVVPTLRDPFTELLLPVKLLEYVHMGLPAVAPRLPVIEQYFSDQDLMLFEPGSVESLAGALSSAWAEPRAARARAERAAVHLAMMAWDGQRRRYLALLDGLAGRAPEAEIEAADAAAMLRRAAA
jgi:glycosyltransferase involved in cell wall biosynthesis